MARKNVFDTVLKQLNMPAERVDVVNFGTPDDLGASSVSMPPERFDVMNFKPDSLGVSHVNMPAERMDVVNFETPDDLGASVVSMPAEVFAPRKPSRTRLPATDFSEPEGMDFSDAPITLDARKEMDFAGNSLLIDPQADFSEDPAASAIAGMDFSDSPIELKVARQTARNSKGKSKVVSYEPTKRSKGMDFSGSPLELKVDGPQQDPLLQKYQGNADKLSSDRMAALERMAAEKDLSNEEKVATALLAALPGLIGAIGGGAIAGGWGAAAGAAGGLQGGAEGVKGIAASKEARRKEAKGDAEKLLEQIAAQEGLATHRKELLENRDISAKQSAQQREDAFNMLERKEKGDRQNALIQANAMLQAHKIDAESRDYGNRLNAYTDQQKAEAAARAGGAGKQADRDFYANLDTALNSIDKLESVIKGQPGKPGHGNWESRFGDLDAAATLEQVPYELAIAYAKIVDPTSVAREGEVEAARKYMVPMGLLTPNGMSESALKQLRRSLLEKAAARQATGATLPDSAFRAAGTAPMSIDPNASKSKWGF